MEDNAGNIITQGFFFKKTLDTTMMFSVHLHLFYNFVVIQTISTHKLKKTPAKLIAIMNANVFFHL